jgi:hypothetical protein
VNRQVKRSDHSRYGRLHRRTPPHRLRRGQRVCFRLEHYPYCYLDRSTDAQSQWSSLLQYVVFPPLVNHHSQYLAQFSTLSVVASDTPARLAAFKAPASFFRISLSSNHRLTMQIGVYSTFRVLLAVPDLNQSFFSCNFRLTTIMTHLQIVQFRSALSCHEHMTTVTMT